MIMYLFLLIANFSLHFWGASNLHFLSQKVLNSQSLFLSSRMEFCPLYSWLTDFKTVSPSSLYSELNRYWAPHKPSAGHCSLVCLVPRFSVWYFSAASQQLWFIRSSKPYGVLNAHQYFLWEYCNLHATWAK